MNNKYKLLCGVLMVALASLNVQAKVSSKEAAKLGKSLTPFGSIKAGNKNKTIPAWDGGITEPPVGYKGPGKHHIDPFADDEIKFTIDKTNYQGFKKYLTPGQYKMFESYPDTFKIHVYPTRRSHALPEWILENTVKNAKTSSLAKGGVGIVNAYGGIPFPILHGSNSDKALQAMWNHMTRWRGIYWKMQGTEILLKQNGDRAPVTKKQEAFFNFHNPKGNFKKMKNILFYFISENTAPARLAGNILLVHETMDQLKDERSVWRYDSGTRRTRKIPSLQYDAPIVSAQGTRGVDETDMYNGSPDRFNWEYRGVKEYFIPYNNYKISSKGVKYEDSILPEHPNPDYVRWELHRVHVVEATLKKKERHQFGKRTFYIDEDSWGVAMAENYDKRGELWRYNMALLMNYYELPGVLRTIDVYQDFRKMQYSVNGLYSEEKKAPIYTDKIPNKRVFSQSGLRRRGR